VQARPSDVDAPRQPAAPPPWTRNTSTRSIADCNRDVGAPRLRIDDTFHEGEYVCNDCNAKISAAALLEALAEQSEACETCPHCGFVNVFPAPLRFADTHKLARAVYRPWQQGTFLLCLDT